MDLESKDTVVMSDVHAMIGKLEMVYAHFGDGVRYILAGDTANGENTARTIQAAGEIGALLCFGNHEWVWSASMQEADEETRSQYAARWRKNRSGMTAYERNLLSSYGVSQNQSNYQALEHLYKIMWRSGHLDLLNNAKLYYETDEFIVVHAGLTQALWPEQKKELDAVQRQLEVFDFSYPPTQIFDEHDREKGYRLAGQAEDFSATDKIVISGHLHLQATAEERQSASGRRVRLASRLNIGDPLYVWQSWDKQIVAF